MRKTVIKLEEKEGGVKGMKVLKNSLRIKGYRKDGR